MRSSTRHLSHTVRCFLINPPDNSPIPLGYSPPPAHPESAAWAQSPTPGQWPAAVAAIQKGRRLWGFSCCRPRTKSAKERLYILCCCQIRPGNRQHTTNPTTKPAIRLQHQATQLTAKQCDSESGYGETGQVSRESGACGHFCTVGEAVEQHERTNEHAANSRGQFGQGGDENTGHQYGEGDASFNAGQAQTAPGQGGAEDHATDHEGRRRVFHEVILAHTPEPDSGHGQQVVQAQHRVQQAAEEAAFSVGAMAGVSGCRGGGE